MLVRFQHMSIHFQYQNSRMHLLSLRFEVLLVMYLRMHFCDYVIFELLHPVWVSCVCFALM